MQIQNQPQINNKYGYTPHFTSSSREVREGGRLLYRNVTHFFRDDIKNWPKLIDFIIDEYKDIKKVTSYHLGCSKGDAVFGEVALYMEKLGVDGAQKFLPAIAVDIDEVVLKEAQSGKVNVSAGDIKRIKENLGENYRKYFDFDYNFRTVEGENEQLCTATVKPIILNSVKFVKADAREFVKEIEPDNSIVMARNFIPYLKNDIIKFSDDLGQKLQKNSMLVLGEYDLDKSVDAFFLHPRGGFDICEMDYVYKKRPPEVFESSGDGFLNNPDFLKNTFIPKK